MMLPMLRRRPGQMYEGEAYGPNPTGLPMGVMRGGAFPTDTKPPVPDHDLMLTQALQKALLKRMSPASRRLLAMRTLMQRREF